MYSTYRPVYIYMYSTKLYCKLAVRLCTAQTSCLFCTARSQYMYSMHIIPLLEDDRILSRLPKVLRPRILPNTQCASQCCKLLQWESNPGQQDVECDALTITPLWSDREGPRWGSNRGVAVWKQAAYPLDYPDRKYCPNVTSTKYM